MKAKGESEDGKAEWRWKGETVGELEKNGQDQ